jgi:NAD(P)-dependent dehydrogenase (short-subunit alcohol dehydrogenase family)
MVDLRGRTAVVTGAARGIGRAIAARLVRQGAAVVVSDLDGEAAGRTAAELGAVPHRCDVSRGEEARELIRSAVDRFGHLDILVNNAGIIRDAMVHKMSEQQWDEVMAVNLKGVFNCLQPAAAHMRQRGYGRIINIASVAWAGNVGQANYAASKAGVIGLTKTAARELARDGVTVNAVCPGFIETDLTRGVSPELREQMIAKIPLGRPGRPEDVANVVAFLASDEAAYVTGEMWAVSGGMVM